MWLQLGETSKASLSFRDAFPGRKERALRPVFVADALVLKTSVGLRA